MVKEFTIRKNENNNFIIKIDKCQEIQIGLDVEETLNYVEKYLNDMDITKLKTKQEEIIELKKEVEELKELISGLEQSNLIY